MHKRGEKVSVYIYSEQQGCNIWVNGTILRPADIMVNDVDREQYQVMLSNGIIKKVSDTHIEAPINEEVNN